MTSKWIEEIEVMPAIMDMSPASWERELLPALQRIDKLLRLAMHSIESDKQLYDEIWKEIRGDL